MTPSLPIPVVLTAYGLPHVMGFLPAKNGAHPETPLSVFGLMDAAVELGLAGIECDLSRLGCSLEEFKEGLEGRGLRIVTDFGQISQCELETFITFLKDTAQIGAKTARVTLSPVLCGKRNSLPEDWEARIQAVAARLREVLPLAENLGVCIALENHQDATSGDLIRLYEISGESSAYGITLDAGNPLAVGEEPVEAARRMGPLIRHIHMKDYTIHFSPEGYRLVRCAAGDGVVDFPAILEIVKSHHSEILPGIEIAAQQTRTIPLLEDEWWTSFPSDHRKHLLPVLRLLWERGRPMDEPYASAWERGEDSAVVAAEEWDIVRRSADYLHRVFHD